MLLRPAGLWFKVQWVQEPIDSFYAWRNMEYKLKINFLYFSEIPLLAGNAVWRNGSYAGKITTAHYGFNMKKYIAYG